MGAYYLVEIAQALRFRFLRINLKAGQRVEVLRCLLGKLQFFRLETAKAD